MWIAVVVVIALLLGLLPLFGVLGYELALVMSVVAAVAGLDLGAAVAREMQWLDAPPIERASYPGRAVGRGAAASALLSVGVVACAGVVCALRGIWVETCDWGFGVKAYVLMPLTTAALGGAVGHAIGVVVGTKAYRPRHARFGLRLVIGIVLAAVVGGGVRLLGGPTAVIAAAMLGAIVFVVALFGWMRVRPHRSTVVALAAPLLLCAAAGLYRFYAAPPVFTYNPILGYFPGNIYDENVVLGMALVWSRIEQIVWVVAIVALVAWRCDVPTHRVAREPRPAGRRLASLGVGLVAVVAGCALYWYSGILGYRIDGEEIADALGGRIETPHFVIFYARTPEIERDIALIAADHELRYAQVVAQIGEAPPGKLTSYYFADREQKGRWFGARDVEMAKPWRREIYLDHRPFPHTSLRHEIAHAIASEFGDPLFGVAARRVAGVPVFVSPGLIEGFAVAMDWPGSGDRLTPHEAVRALQLMGLQPSIQQLLSLQFLTVSSSRSYQTAGSFLRFLFDAYGAAALRRLYHSGGDFDGVYGKSLATLEGEWRAMISTISVPPDVVEGNRERFRGGSVFARPCPHAIAAQRERAAEAYADGRRVAAVGLMRAVCSDAPGEPRYQLELGDFLAGGDPRERTEAVARWTSLALDDNATSSLRADAYERLVRVAASRGDLAQIKALVAAARALPVDPTARRQLDAEWFTLEYTGPAATALRGYFFAPGGGYDPATYALLAAITEPDLGFGHYLLGLQKANALEWADAAAELSLALDHELPGLAFVRNGARRLAVVAYRAGDRAHVARAIEVLRRPEMTESDHLLATDWQQRLELDATGHITTQLPPSFEMPASK
jgi:hypothetical protein